MAERITIRRLTIGTVFKLAAISLFPLVLLFAFFGLLALGGAQVVHVNGQYVTGLGGLIAALIMAPIFWMILTVFLWLSSFVSLFVFSLLRPMNLSYVPDAEGPVA